VADRQEDIQQATHPEGVKNLQNISAPPGRINTQAAHPAQQIQPQRPSPPPQANIQGQNATPSTQQQRQLQTPPAQPLQRPLNTQPFNTQPTAQLAPRPAPPINEQGQPSPKPLNTQGQAAQPPINKPTPNQKTPPPAVRIASATTNTKTSLNPEDILAQIAHKTAADTFSPDVLTDKDPDSEEEAIKQLKRSPLGEKLIYRGLISKDQLETALKEQRTQTGANRKLLGAILVEMGFITESTLGELLTEESGVKKFNIQNAVLDPTLIRKVPQEVALRYKAVPVSIEGDNVMVLISDIYNILAIDQIRNYFPSNLKISPIYGSEPEIMEIIDQYHGYETSIEGILKEIESGIIEQKAVISGESSVYTNPTVRLVDAILIDAIKKGASDIHFEPENTFLRIRYRIDGKLIQVRSFHKDYWPAVVVRIKIMAGANIAETRNPQDGRVSFFVLGREIDFRVATHPTVFGENIVMRILDKQKALVPLEKLGFSTKNEKFLMKLLKKPEGIIIVTGPTGSGKTTTLYSVLNYINSVDINIMTLENPVEYQLPMIRQSDIKEDKGMDFVTGIKSLMRQDPDVIFVGEIRDEATATMAMRAAMTGHRVFSTLHTNDAFGAIPRLIDVGVPAHLLSGTLICVIAQRLLRKLCSKCKTQTEATEEDLQILGIQPGQKVSLYTHSEKGCAECVGSGYKGRVAAHEVFPVDKGMDELISSGAPRRLMIEYATNKGFIPILQDGIEKVLAGVTDMEELVRVLDVTERL
jgi:type IV pilus assembly protein PilB